MLELRVSALILQPDQSETSRKSISGFTDRAVRHHVDTVLASGIRDTVLVMSKPSASLARAFRGLPVRFAVRRPDDGGMDGQIRFGITFLGNEPSGVLFCRADDPVPSVRLIRSLALDHYAFCNRIIAPAIQGKRKNPLLFPREVLQEALSGITVEEILAKDPRRVRMTEVSDNAAPNMDTTSQKTQSAVCEIAR